HVVEQFEQRPAGRNVRRSDHHAQRAADEHGQHGSREPAIRQMPHRAGRGRRVVHFVALAGSCAIAFATASSRSGVRGPQRDAMSSSSSTTAPLFTARSPENPGRAATVLSDSAQHLVSPSTMRSGSALIKYSAESCGYPDPDLSAASAMLSRPSNLYIAP